MANIKKRYIYPAIVTKESTGYSVVFPDLPGCFPHGKTFVEANDNAKEALALHLYGMIKDREPVPGPSMPNFALKKHQAILIVEVIIAQFLRKYLTQSVKKSLSIPKWLDELAQENKVNYSQVLQLALMEHLGVDQGIFAKTNTIMAKGRVKDMSNYPYEHDKGSLVYKKEQYSFRYRGVPAADIEIISVPGENSAYSIQVEKDEKHWPDLQGKYFEKLSAGCDVLKDLGFTQIFYETKQDALQTAISAIESILHTSSVAKKMYQPNK